MLSKSSSQSSMTVRNHEEEISQYASNERRMEQYGGDDIREPESKGGVAHQPSHAPAEFSVEDQSKFVTWDSEEDPQNPQNWTNAYRWAITILCAVMTVNVTFASSAPSSATTRVVAQFGTSQEVGYLITSLFLVGYVFGPFFWGPGSELIGRRPIICFTMTAYTLFFLGQALATNIETLLITRFFGGFFAVAPLTIAGGIIADMWSAAGRGPATSLFSASVFLGPVLGPVVGGFVAQDMSLKWNLIFWILLAFAGLCTIITIIWIPETYAPIILLKKTKNLRKANPEKAEAYLAEHEDQDWSWKGVLHRTLFRPFIMLFLEPILLLITVYLSIVYGILYALFEAFPIIFEMTRGFNPGESGLMFVGVGIGTTIGAIINNWQGRHYPELLPKWKGFPPAELRLTGAMVGAPLLAVGAFWLGWTGNYPSVPWYVPGLATIVLGAAISLIFMSFLSYLVDTYLMYSASAFAANTIIRSAVGAAFPLFTVQMFQGMGINWACTLVGCVSLLLAPSPFLFYRYGAKIRERSRFAPCIDLQIAKEIAEEEKQKAGQV